MSFIVDYMRDNPGKDRQTFDWTAHGTTRGWARRLFGYEFPEIGVHEKRQFGRIVLIDFEEQEPEARRFPIVHLPQGENPGEPRAKRLVIE